MHARIGAATAATPSVALESERPAEAAEVVAKVEPEPEPALPGWEIRRDLPRGLSPLKGPRECVFPATLYSSSGCFNSVEASARVF